MMMRSILALAAGHLRLELKDRYNLFWMLVMPVVFVTVFGYAFRGGGPTRFGLTVVDGDQSFLSNVFVEMLEGEELDVRNLTPAQADTAAEGIRTLTIPAGFSDSLAVGDRVALPFDLGKRRRPENDLAVRVHLYKAVARMLTTLAVIDTSVVPGTLAVASDPFQTHFREIREHPDLIQAKVSTGGRGRTLPTGHAASAQSMLVLFLLMNTSISGAILLAQDRQSGVLARLTTLPISRVGLLSGRIVGLLGLTFVQSAIMLIFGRLAFNVYWGPDPLALGALLLCLGLAAASLGIFLGAVLRTPEQASAIAWIVPLFLGAIGGCWWPLEVTSEWMQTAGHVSPAAWAMDGMHGLISFGKGARAVFLPCIVLLGYAAVLTAIGSRLLRASD